MVTYLYWFLVAALVIGTCLVSAYGWANGSPH